jgi:hypothetical protein
MAVDFHLKNLAESVRNKSSDSQDDYVVSAGIHALDVETVKIIAVRNGYQLVKENTMSAVLCFRGECCNLVNVYYTTGTVGTCLDHPTQGKTQSKANHIGSRY